MFKVGDKKVPGSGMKKGGRQKKTLAYEAILAKHGFNPAEAMLWVFAEAKKDYQSPNVIEKDKPKFLGICGKMASDMATYIYAKPKNPIEATVQQSVEGFKIIVQDYTVNQLEEKKE